MATVHTLPLDVLGKVLTYLPPTPDDLLPLCGVSRAWREIATRDLFWYPVCSRIVGSELLSILDVRRRFFEFYIRRRRCLYGFTPVIRPERHDDAVLCCDSAPPSSFFGYSWVVEIRDAARRGPPIYTAVLGMDHEAERGRLFTSAGVSVVGSGVRVYLDVKNRLPPLLSDDSFEEKQSVGERKKRRQDGSQYWRFGQAPSKLALDIFVYDSRRGRLALFISDVLRPYRPPRWLGRDWDGPFLSQPTTSSASSLCIMVDAPYAATAAARAKPSTSVVLDDVGHVFRASPVVELADWGDKVYLLGVRVDLGVCLCEVGLCECGPHNGIISAEAHSILFRDLLESKLRWY